MKKKTKEDVFRKMERRTGDFKEEKTNGIESSWKPKGCTKLKTTKENVT